MRSRALIKEFEDMRNGVWEIGFEFGLALKGGVGGVSWC